MNVILQMHVCFWLLWFNCYMTERSLNQHQSKTDFQKNHKMLAHSFVTNTRHESPLDGARGISGSSGFFLHEANNKDDNKAAHSSHLMTHTKKSLQKSLLLKAARKTSCCKNITHLVAEVEVDEPKNQYKNMLNIKKCHRTPMMPSGKIRKSHNCNVFHKSQINRRALHSALSPVATPCPNSMSSTSLNTIGDSKTMRTGKKKVKGTCIGIILPKAKPYLCPTSININTTSKLQYKEVTLKKEKELKTTTCPLKSTSLTHSVSLTKATKATSKTTKKCTESATLSAINHDEEQQSVAALPSTIWITSDIEEMKTLMYYSTQNASQYLDEHNKTTTLPTTQIVGERTEHTSSTLTTHISSSTVQMTTYTPVTLTDGFRKEVPGDVLKTPCKPNEPYCVCSLPAVVQDFKRLASNHSSKFIQDIENYNCSQYFSIPQHIVLSRETIKRDTRGAHELTCGSMSFNPADFRRVMKSVTSLKSTSNHTYAFPGSDISLSCSGANENVTDTHDTKYHWTKGSRRVLTGNRIGENGSGNLHIKNTVVDDMGEYCCHKAYLNPTTGLKEDLSFRHEVSVVLLPNYFHYSTEHYLVSSSCSDINLNLLAQSLPKMVTQLLCGGNDLCTIQLVQPSCHNNPNGTIYIDVNFHIHAVKLYKVIKDLNHTFCDVMCKQVSDAKFLTLISKNMIPVLRTAVYSRLSAVESTFTPVEDSFSFKIFMGCAAGYHLVQGLCVPCSPGTYSDEDDIKCTECPAVMYQPKYGSKACRLCPHPFAGRGCFAVLWRRAGYITLMVIIFLTLEIFLLIAFIHFGIIFWKKFKEKRLKKEEDQEEKDPHKKTSFDEPDFELIKVCMSPKMHQKIMNMRESNDVQPPQMLRDALCGKNCGCGPTNEAARYVLPPKQRRNGRLSHDEPGIEAVQYGQRPQVQHEILHKEVAKNVEHGEWQQRALRNDYPRVLPSNSTWNVGSQHTRDLVPYHLRAQYRACTCSPSSSSKYSPEETPDVPGELNISRP